VAADWLVSRGAAAGIALCAAASVWTALPGVAAAQSAGETGAAPAGRAAPANQAGPTLRATSVCIDQEIADRLAVKRRRRQVVDRLFVKQARHELSLVGGYYVSDLFSSTYALGASYTYHMTENTAVELAGALTHANADLIGALEGERNMVLEDDYAQVRFLESLLVWSPVYGKLRLGGQVMRFDIHLDAGVGVIDSPTSRGAAGAAGLGVKLFAGRAFAIRLDARDHIYRQELLAERFIVNDFSFTLGLSLFLPMRN